MDKQKELDAMVAKYEKQVQKLQAVLVQFALKHDLRLTLSDYGEERTLLTKKDMDKDGGHWSGYGVGEWLSSSDGC